MASKDATNVIPAPNRIANCRVATESSAGLTRLKKVEIEVLSGVACPGVDEVSFNSIGKTPEPLSFCLAATGLSASMIPFLFLPALSRALYS